LTQSTSITRAGAIKRYTEIAHRLPDPVNPTSVKHIENLYELVDEVDVFVLDGFGVLNIGETTIPGAAERVDQLQKKGKQVLVLTNGATLPASKTVEKYRNWGMRFQSQDVISSRNALEHAVRDDKNVLWGVIAPEFAEAEKLAPQTKLLGDNKEDYASVDGFIFLSSTDLSDLRQQLLCDALAEKSRPLLVGNPDLVAPREGAMSLEPGFKAVFDLAAARITNVEPHRIVMVGDSLHTDILGGASYGWRTVLIKNHGLMKEADDELTFTETGIRPHFIAQA